MQYSLYVEGSRTPRQICSLTREVTNVPQDTTGTYEEVRRVKDSLSKLHPKATYTIEVA